MGLYELQCRLCGSSFMWFSGDLDQRCHECRKGNTKVNNVKDEIQKISSSSTVKEVETAVANIKSFLNDKLGLDPQVQVSTENGKPTVHVQFKISL